MVQKPRAEPSRRSVAEALVKASDPTKVVAYFCKNCGTVYSDKGGTGKEDAERCTVRTPWHGDTTKASCTEWSCEKCGNKCSPYMWYCSGCRDERRTDWETEKLSKAEVVSDYPSDQGVFWRDSYYNSIEDLLDYCEYEDIEVPARVWATRPEPFKLDVDDILEHAFENWAEGCEDAEACYEGEEALREAVKAFNEANEHKVLYYESDKAVDLTEYR